VILDRGPQGSGWSILGLPGQDTVTVPDAVVIRGDTTQVRPEHAGMALNLQSTLTIAGGATVEVDGRVSVAGAVIVDGSRVLADRVDAHDLALTNRSLLTSLTSTTSGMRKLEVNVTGTLKVDSTSAIDVSGKGYLPGYTSGNTRAGGATGNAGGSFGGAAGGGVYVAVATLEGTGRIDAAGAPGGFGGGGGGRVAVYATDLSRFDTDRITAAAGQAFYASNGNGGAGTVHITQGLPHTHVRSYSPVGLNGGHVRAINSVILTFNRPIDLTSFGPSVFEIIGQMGRVVPTGITLVGDRAYQIALPFPLTEDGPYHFQLLPSLRNTQGFQLDQNANGIPGEGDDRFSWDLGVDTIPPRVTQHSPAGDVAGTVEHVDVWFSKVIDTTTFTTSQVAMTRPDGGSVAVSSIAEVGLTRFRNSFPAPTLVGQYHVKVGPHVADLAGNLLDHNGNGIPGEPGDVYDASFNLVAVELGLSNLTLSSDHLTAGQPITVSWEGANRTGAALLGAWTDAVYLSTSDHWDINAIPLGTVPHTGGLAQGQPYSGAATALIPGALPGNYHILVRADVYNQEHEGANQATNVIATPVPLAVPVLAANGATAHGSLTTNDPSDYYAVHVNGGDSLGLALAGHADTAVDELYASFEAIPTRLSYDFRSVKSDRDLTGQNQSLALVAPPGRRHVLYPRLRRPDRQSAGLRPVGEFRPIHHHHDHARQRQQPTARWGPTLLSSAAWPVGSRNGHHQRRRVRREHHRSVHRRRRHHARSLGHPLRLRPAADTRPRSDELGGGCLRRARGQGGGEPGSAGRIHGRCPGCRAPGNGHRDALRNGLPRLHAASHLGGIQEHGRCPHAGARAETERRRSGPAHRRRRRSVPGPCVPEPAGQRDRYRSGAGHGLRGHSRHPATRRLRAHPRVLPGARFFSHSPDDLHTRHANG
jgi:hypothetical protein